MYKKRRFPITSLPFCLLLSSIFLRLLINYHIEYCYSIIVYWFTYTPSCFLDLCKSKPNISTNIVRLRGGVFNPPPPHPLLIYQKIWIVRAWYYWKHRNFGNFLAFFLPRKPMGNRFLNRYIYLSHCFFSLWIWNETIRTNFLAWVSASSK